MDEDGNRSFKKGSLRLDVVLYSNEKAFVAFDMKVGTAGKGNAISAAKYGEYQRRFGAMLFTVHLKI